MKKIALIDGENAVHAISHILARDKRIKSRENLKKIDLRELLSSVGEIKNIQYYSTRIQVPEEKSLLNKKIEQMRIWNSFWIPYIANQNIKIVKAGILKVRDSKRCLKCGHKTEVLIEKGVDVRLGVDIVMYGAKGYCLYLLSSDSDLIPAVKVARKAGAQVIYVAFEGNVNRALSKCSTTTKIITKQEALNSYDKVNAR